MAIGNRDRYAECRETLREQVFSSPRADDQGPSARATVISLSLHAAGLLAFICLLRTGDVPVHLRPIEVTMLHEMRLVDPVPPSSASSRPAPGAGTGSRANLPASHGATLPRAEAHTSVPPLVITVPKPKLEVSSTLLDVPPPRIEENFRYGDPASSSLPLSAGSGFAGIGSEPHSSAGPNGGGGSKSPSGSGPIFSLSEVTQAPMLVYKVDPDYSEQARLSRYNGTVVLGVVIDEKGDPKDIRVLRSLGLGLDEKAVEAVRRWRFRPGLRDGKAVAVDANIEVNFQLL